MLKHIFFTREHEIMQTPFYEIHERVDEEII